MRRAGRPRSASRREPLEAVMVEGRPHCPECRVEASGIVDYGLDGDRVWFVVTCPQCKRRVRYTRDIQGL